MEASGMIPLPTCPICGTSLPPEAASQSPLFPFCSLRCKQVDLYRWMTGRYAVVESLTIERLVEEAGRDAPPLDELPE